MPIDGVNATGTITYRLERVETPTESTDFDTALRDATGISSGDLEGIFQAAASQYQVPVSLLKAVAKVESNFNPQATSRCGAMGVMQLMPGTAQGLGVDDAYNAQQNIMGGAKYLSQLLHRYDGSTSLALAAYNAGPGRVSQADGVPAFAQGYVDKVMRYYGGGASVGDAASLSAATQGQQGASSATQGGEADRMTTMMMIYQLMLDHRLGGGGQEDPIG